MIFYKKKWNIFENKYFEIFWNLYESKLYELKNYMSWNYMSLNYMSWNYMNWNCMNCNYMSHLENVKDVIKEILRLSLIQTR